MDVGPEILIWVGKDSSKKEKAVAFSYAQKYLDKYERPNWLPISKVLEGGENEYFNSFFN